MQAGQRRVEETKAALALVLQKGELLHPVAELPEDAASPPEMETVDTAIFTEVAVILPEDNTDALDVRKDIYDALMAVSEPLARGYVQVKKDLADSERLSW